MSSFDDPLLKLSRGLLGGYRYGNYLINTALGDTLKSTKESVHANAKAKAEYKELTDFQSFMADCRQRGISKQNRFITIFKTMPGNISTNFLLNNNMINSALAETVETMKTDNLAFITRSCEMAQFPGIVIQTQESRFQNHTEKMPVNRTYNEVTMTFRCDAEMTEKKFFDMWFSKIVDKESGDIYYKKDYAIEAEMIQFNEEGRAVYAVILDGFYPINMTDLELNHASRDEYHRLTVTFAYNKINVVGIDSQLFKSSAAASLGVNTKSTFDKLVSTFYSPAKNILSTYVATKSPVKINPFN